MRVTIKICGLTESDGVAAAVDAGADAIGFVFAASPREVSPAQAARLLAGIPSHISKVAVFRIPDAKILTEVLTLPFDVIQAADGWQGASHLPRGVRFLPSLADGEALLPRVLAAMHRQPMAGPVHVDAPGGGGLGVLADHCRIAAVAWRYPVILAGGLSADNIAEAIASVRPVGVDVSSGVESSRGVKDCRLITEFITVVRETCDRLARRPAMGGN